MEEIEVIKDYYSEKIQLQIPLFRQRFESYNWKKDGFLSVEDSAVWSDRSCGIACVRMVIGYFFPDKIPSLPKLLNQGLQISAYCSRGWIHAKLVELLGFYNVAGEAIGITSDLNFIISKIKIGQPIIASITEKFPCDGKKGGHLVVVNGYVIGEDGQTLIFFNDPSAWGQSNNSVTAERFFSSFSGRIIVCSMANNS
jgi:Peptidase_C39 like family